MSASTPRRVTRPGRPPEIRKARSFRPKFDPCEVRVMLSGAATGVVLEPLQFSATTVSRVGLPTEVAGTLRLTEGPKGGLAGTLVEANGESLRVRGTLRGEQISLNISTSNRTTIRAVGPVVSAEAADGPILHGGGLILGSGQATRGTFTLKGSDVVLPAEQLQTPGSVARVIPAGTTLVPSNFVGTVTRGPDAGMTLSGVLSLGKVAGNGSFAGSLADPSLGTIPVSGRIVGGRIQLAFDIGPGNQFGGVGPFEAQKIGKGRVMITSFGSLRTGNLADSGDWVLKNSPLSNQNLSSTGNYSLALSNNLLIGTNFMYTEFASINITNSTLQSVNLWRSYADDPGTVIIRYSNLQNVDFSYSRILEGADLTGSDLSGAKLTYAVLSFANLTGTNLPSNLGYAILDGTNLAGRQLANDYLYDATLKTANLAGANLAGANLTGADLTGANLRGALLTNVTGLSAKAQLEYQLQNLGGVGLNLSGQDLSGDDLQNVNLGGANLTNANLTGANLVGATLTTTNLSNAQLTGALLTNDDLSTVTLAMASATEIDLDGANLSGANLSNLMLGDYDMAGANLSGANLYHTELSRNLTNANLIGANLQRAALIGTDLGGANLTRANLTGADLQGANLRGAVITGVIGLASSFRTVYTLQNSGGAYLNISAQDLDREDLSNVDLTFANLTGDNLSFVNFAGATLSRAIFDNANLTGTGLTAATLTAAHASFSPTTKFS